MSDQAVYGGSEGFDKVREATADWLKERDWTVAPAEQLQEWMELKGLTLDRFEREYGNLYVRHAKRVLERQPYSGLTAHALSDLTGYTPAYWLGLERQYREDLAKGRKESE